MFLSPELESKLFLAHIHKQEIKEKNQLARIWIFACAAGAWLSQLEAQTEKKRMRMKPDMPRVAVYHFILEESLLSLESMTKTKRH